MQMCSRECRYLEDDETIHGPFTFCARKPLPEWCERFDGLCPDDQGKKCPCFTRKGTP